MALARSARDASVASNVKPTSHDPIKLFSYQHTAAGTRVDCITCLADASRQMPSRESGVNTPTTCSRRAISASHPTPQQGSPLCAPQMLSESDALH